MFEAEIQQAVDLAKAGRHAEARAILKEIVRQDKNCLNAWRGLARLAETDEQKIYCLRQILRLKPGDPWATERLRELEGGSAG